MLKAVADDVMKAKVSSPLPGARRSRTLRCSTSLNGESEYQRVLTGGSTQVLPFG
ncbi:hypothetical protein [Kitasatospora sp. NPDC001683]